MKDDPALKEELDKMMKEKDKNLLKLQEDLQKEKQRIFGLKKVQRDISVEKEEATSRTKDDQTTKVVV